MSALRWISDSAGLQMVGWTVLHSLWQVALVGAVLAAVLRATRRSAPAVRYGIACSALLTMCVLPLGTGVGIGRVWREHEACWGIAAGGAALPEHCWGHGLAPEAVVDEAKASVPLAPTEMLSVELTPAVAWLGLAWLAGVGVLSLRMLVAWRLVRRLRTVGAVAVTGATAERARRVAERVGVRRPVSLLVTSRVEVPAVVGWRKPAVLLPPGVAERLSPEALDTVLAHELSHVRREDFLVNLLQSCADVLLFHHPFARRASARIREEREYCCDEAAVASAPGALPVYLRALVELDAGRHSASPAPSLSVAGGALLPRARRLAQGTHAPIGLARLAAAVLLGASLLWLPFLELEPPVGLTSWAVMTVDLEARVAQRSRAR